MTTCEYCHQLAVIIHNDELLCEKHFEHFYYKSTFSISKQQALLANLEKKDVPKIDCEKVFNRKYINLMVDFTTMEQYQSILADFKQDVRTVKRKSKLYKSAL